MIQTPKLTASKIGVYLFLFFAIWSVRELYIRPVFLNPLNPIDSELIGAAIKLLVWTLPAILLIKHFHDDMWVGLKEMFTSKLQWSRDALFASVFIALLLGRPVLRLITYGELGFRSDFVPIRLVGLVLFVGITEEFVFRGFLLNTFLRKMKMPYAIALDAVLFILIHYPIWIYNGRGVDDLIRSSIVVLPISVFFAYSFIKTRNIFVPIALHMAWNFSTVF